MKVTLDPETQLALEQLIVVSKCQTGQGRLVANFLLILWHIGKYVRSSSTDQCDLDPEVCRSCVRLFRWLSKNEMCEDKLSCQCKNGIVGQGYMRESAAMDLDLNLAVDGILKADFAMGQWNDRWVMSDETVRCSYCLATQLPSNANSPLDHYDGCEIGEERYPLRDLAMILSSAFGESA